MATKNGLPPADETIYQPQHPGDGGEDKGFAGFGDSRLRKFKSTGDGAFTEWPRSAAPTPDEVQKARLEAESAREDARRAASYRKGGRR